MPSPIEIKSGTLTVRYEQSPFIVDPRPRTWAAPRMLTVYYSSPIWPKP